MSSYSKERDKKILERIDSIIADLPSVCLRFFLGIAQTTTPLTRLGYAFDLKQFFEYLVDTGVDIHNENCLEELTVQDIELFIASLHEVGPAGKQRKLCTLRSMFAYLYKVDLLTKNIMPKIDLPKVAEKPIVRLEDKEVVKILNAPAGEMSLRDETILILFLTTGIRVSELVGLDVSDIDLANKSFAITRKGGARVILYLPDQTVDKLSEYLQDREEGALFTTAKGTRLGVRAIQLIVKRYAALAAPLKNISPHKLRSTFGTNLYNATRDIYMVADVLGHRDVNTTKKHYAAITEDQRREAAKHVDLPTCTD